MMKMMHAIAKMSDNVNDLALTKVVIPAIDDHELLVSVRAIGVGIHDGYFFPAKVTYPYPIGIEAAGVVEKIGEKVKRFKIGERISFISAMQAKGGTWAEFAVVSEDSLIMQMPEDMMFTEAAAVPVAGNTVLKAFHALRLEPKESLFIAGASGAIGTFPIQLAVAKGCVVGGSASPGNHAYMQALGAVKTVDYHDVDWVDQIKQWQPKGLDGVLAIQPGTGSECLPLLKNQGRMVVVSGDQVSTQRGITVSQIPQEVDVVSELKFMMKQIVDKKFKLEIGQIFKFENSLEALKRTQTRHARGKLIIEL